MTSAKAAMDHTTAHTAMVARIRLALGRQKDLALWPNPVKLVEAITNTGTIRMRTGLCPGSADLVGILSIPVTGIGTLMPIGRFFALEVKTGRGVAKPHQEEWLDLVRKLGGFAAVVRSEQDAIEALERARRGESS